MIQILRRGSDIVPHLYSSSPTRVSCDTHREIPCVSLNVRCLWTFDFQIFREASFQIEMPEDLNSELGHEADDVIFEWSDFTSHGNADSEKISAESSASESGYRHALEVCLLVRDIRCLTQTTK